MVCSRNWDYVIKNIQAVNVVRTYNLKSVKQVLENHGYNVMMTTANNACRVN